ncbi:MAG: DASS family sodium-coupled anion symporter [Planctomycetes bacterium]|nr:DASS family sodium-coupled anion symporter [Planctomycetota bacterium]
MERSNSNLRIGIHWAGFIAGPVLALTCYALLPDQFTNAAGETVALAHAGQITLAVMVWMAIWWLTEAVNITITALLPIVLFPIFGAADITVATAPYANKIIFLFAGGFLLALSMQRWGLDKRIALITLRLVGTKPTNMILGFMLVTAVLSAFVSNTATTAMMLPIALSVIALVCSRQTQEDTADQGQNFALCLMLGIAYAASIGGIATIIGTPPNAILVEFIGEYIAEEYQSKISFARWMMIGVPLAAVFLPITWLLLTRLIYPIRIKQIPGGSALIKNEYNKLGKTSKGEWITFIVFMLAAVCWIFQRNISSIEFELSEQIFITLEGLTDHVIAMLAAILLFVIPVDIKKRTFVMNWDTAKKLPWGILILFGGGLSLAAAVEANGVAEFLGSQSAAFAGFPAWIIVLIVIVAVIFLTELTSNTATTATLVPILAALAPGLGLHPYMLIVPAAIAASCAFMMPVATPPNAIVFGSGHITIPQMCKAGLWLNIIGIILVMLLAYTIIGTVLGI